MSKTENNNQSIAQKIMLMRFGYTVLQVKTVKLLPSPHFQRLSYRQRVLGEIRERIYSYISNTFCSSPVPHVKLVRKYKGLEIFPVVFVPPHLLAPLAFSRNRFPYLQYVSEELECVFKDY